MLRMFPMSVGNRRMGEREGDGQVKGKGREESVCGNGERKATVVAYRPQPTTW